MRKGNNALKKNSKNPSSTNSTYSHAILPKWIQAPNYQANQNRISVLHINLKPRIKSVEKIKPKYQQKILSRNKGIVPKLLTKVGKVESII